MRVVVHYQSVEQDRPSHCPKRQWAGLELNLRAYEITFIVFGATDWESANQWYVDIELQTRDNLEIVVVLVASRSVAELRRAYPNFFADIERFMRLVQETVG